MQNSETPKSIEIVPYNSNWPLIFETESYLIQQTLGDNCLNIHHIGSTSVPGLTAKPKIDIIAVVKNGNLSIVPLEKAGFKYKGEWNIPFKFGFTKRGESNINLHVFEGNHPEIELNIIFRNHLRHNPESLKEYAKLKEELLSNPDSFKKQAGNMFSGYNLGKDEFIRNILKLEGYTGYRFLRATHHNEWKAAKHLRNKYFFDPLGITDPYTWTFNHQEHAHLVFYRGVKVIGYAHIQFWPESRAAMRIIVIDESIRHKDIGSTFLALIEKWLKTLYIKSIHAKSRQNSLNFYLKNGYSKMPFEDHQKHESDPNDIHVGKIL